MDSDLHHNHHHLHHQHQHQHQQQQQQVQKAQTIMNSGLTRYRSAPSSYFSDLMSSGAYGDDDSDPFFNPRASNTETDQILSRFTSSSSAVAGVDSTSHQIINRIGDFEKQFMDCIKQEQEVMFSESQQKQQQQQQQPIVYQNQFQSRSQTVHNNQSIVSTSTSTVVDSLTTMNPPTNLLRQSSSPAGFLSQLDIDNGYPLMRSVVFRGGGVNLPNSLHTTTKRPKTETNFSSGSHLSSGLLPRIPETESEAKILETKATFNDGGFGANSWDDSDILSDSFLKEFVDDDQNKPSNLKPSENQHYDMARIRAPSTLIHHMSLPASSAELNKLMQFQDTVPLKSRAKRGCATHPRSIAERVRRTRISERMRKLQELVPNMDKQTNTADMLDLAVDYIKELQKEAETLSNHHAKCTCPHKPEV